jgi:hypothetical protein
MCGTVPNPLPPDGTFTCQATGVARPGLYANVGTVTANGPSGQVVTDRDLSHYTVPSLHL